MSRPDELKQLRDETTKLHAERTDFVADIRQIVVEMGTNFRNTHAEMTEKLRETLAESETKRKQDAHTLHTERITFISSLKQEISDLKQEISDLMKGFKEENAAAHQAWSGKGV